MYINRERKVIELLKQDIDDKLKIFLSNNVQIGVEAFLQFKAENRAFLEFPKSTLVLGHLLSYSVEKQLYNAVFSPETTLTANIKKVNGYGCKIVEIASPNFVFNIGKTRTKNALLNKSKYKIEAAKMNLGLIGEQLSLNWENLDKISFNAPKKYAQITYGFNTFKGELEYVNILIPNADYTDNIYLLELLSKEKSGLYLVDKKEEMLVSLKKDINKKFRNGLEKEAN